MGKRKLEVVFIYLFIEDGDLESNVSLGITDINPHIMGIDYNPSLFNKYEYTFPIYLQTQASIKRKIASLEEPKR